MIEVTYSAGLEEVHGPYDERGSFTTETTTNSGILRKIKKVVRENRPRWKGERLFVDYTTEEISEFEADEIREIQRQERKERRKAR